MSRVCELTGTKTFSGNKVSHSNIKTRTKWRPNVQGKRYMIPELSERMTIKLSTRAIRTIDKLGGISNAILSVKQDKLSDRLQAVRAKILKIRARASGQKSSATAN